MAASKKAKVRKGKSLLWVVVIILATIAAAFFINKAAMSHASNFQTSRFVSEGKLRSILARQLRMTKEGVQWLHENHHIQSTDSLRLRYSFQTDDSLKAIKLIRELKKRKYKAELEKYIFEKAFFITGKTTRIRMAEDILAPWTKSMCELGYEHDCEFDGWEADLKPH